ncbi:hypothetical protein Bca52824_074568 [Brassica carinata]|uniref:Uncharacterized protein n=1 Tax=Brassica carinata TaxID=52824 RepID=A0A8X7PMR5_BRACI|nr:hypothetical protein Bca52824_074568 [Brassica carinata]
MEASSVVLKPCAAVTAEEECSTELETEAMEKRQRKRKAELDPEEEEEESVGEIEEDMIEESEDDDIDLLEVQQWDVDSFDGLVYSSSTER